MPRFLANLDMYRKVPVDLLEGSRQGSIISWMALIVIVSLAFMETRDYFTSKLQTDLALDRAYDKFLLVNFNITMMDLKCEYVSIDVVSFLGKQQNVTKHVEKWAVSAEGIQEEVLHRNIQQHDIRLMDEKVTQTIEELHDDGEHAISLDDTTFKFALEDHEFVFVDFFASWCSHCVQFAPTWETLAEIMDNTAQQLMHSQDYTDAEYESAKMLKLPVLIAKVDCVVHQMLCFDNAIFGYPTIRLFIDGKRYGNDYWGHRDVYSLVKYLSIAEESVKDPDRIAHAERIAQHHMHISPEEQMWVEKLARQHEQSLTEWNPKEHPGCRIAGTLMMDRTPGHFFIEARSPNHDISPFMTNVSHIVHHLSFGDLRILPHDVPAPPGFEASTRPMNEHVYVTTELHQAHHHYLKLISTNLYFFQVLQSSQLSYYTNDQVPEAKFIIDLSPIRVTYRWSHRHWYDYITSLMAIVGGTFTVVGMVASGMRVATTTRRMTPNSKLSQGTRY